METIEMQAEMADNVGMGDSSNMMQPMGQMDNDPFQRSNDLRVIQEYNREENMPDDIKRNFWAFASKSIKLGFWDKADEKDLYFIQNNINIGHIMSKSKHRYSFSERQQMNMLKLILYADFKRGVGMERYKINERTLQATSVTQNIQGSANSPVGKRGGVLSGLRSMFS